MSKTFSSMLALGTIAPDFSLWDVNHDKLVRFSDNPQNTPSVVMFICNHCPYVKHVNSELTKLALDYMPKSVRFFAINSNDIEQYPDDSPVEMKQLARIHGYPFPYLFDPTQEVAEAYQATCTPDFFVFDANRMLAYRGQLDDSRPGNSVAVNGQSIRHALDCILANKHLDFQQKPSMGCNIKWKVKSVDNALT